MHNQLNLLLELTVPPLKFAQYTKEYGGESQTVILAFYEPFLLSSSISCLVLSINKNNNNILIINNYWMRFL